jgi:hypothetical protein
MRGLDVNMAEDAIVKETREIAPDLVSTELSDVTGPERMGPSLPAMDHSGDEAVEAGLIMFEQRKKQNALGHGAFCRDGKLGTERPLVRISEAQLSAFLLYSLISNLCIKIQFLIGCHATF